MTGARGGLNVHQDSIRLSGPDLVHDLRDLLGAKLIAYIGWVKETRAVRLWAGGERGPSSEVLRPWPEDAKEESTHWIVRIVDGAANAELDFAEGELVLNVFSVTQRPA